ncbi:hypothetical protein JZ751_016054 [Albula glossodonta]|uniref:Uncharacterized protein n=1 Tax=Albula glossodonta TaxID=121402 RepID=A0A8T2P1S2_9TELE|nr:hypothetical protein JZ751_016054 [Albula glossodonta]
MWGLFHSADQIQPQITPRFQDVAPKTRLPFQLAPPVHSTQDRTPVFPPQARRLASPAPVTASCLGGATVPRFYYDFLFGWEKWCPFFIAPPCLGGTPCITLETLGPKAPVCALGGCRSRTEFVLGDRVEHSCGLEDLRRGLRF